MGGVPKGYVWPRAHCAHCGVEAVLHKGSETSVRVHACPHGVRCYGADRDDAGNYKMPYRNVRGEWAVCPVCIAVAAVRDGMGLDGQPEWRVLVGVKARS